MDLGLINTDIFILSVLQFLFRKMSRQGKKDKSVDHNQFLKNIEKYIKDHNINGVFVGHQGGSDLVAGEKRIVETIKENSLITTQDILNKAKEQAEGTDEELEFDTWRGKNIFPPLPCSPTSKSWDYEARRAYLRTMFNRIGFFKGSFLSFKEPSHCPDGFPADKLSWVTFGKRGGPNGVTKSDADKIIESLLSHYMPGKKMSEYYRGYVEDDEDGDQSTRPLPASARPSSPATPGPSSRPAPIASTPKIPSFSGTPTIIFKQGTQIEHEEGELDSSLEDTEHNITYHDDSDNEQNEDQCAEEEQCEESTGGEKEKSAKNKKRKLSPIKLPASHYVLSEAEKRRERNIQERERQYQEWERKRALEEGQKTSDSILGLNIDADDMD